MTYEALRLDYEAYVWEHRACGLEYLSFEEWSGQDSGSSRARAEARWHRMDEDDTLDLY
jgi:hypothetical protein